MTTTLSRLLLTFSLASPVLWMVSRAAADDIHPSRTLDPTATVRFGDLNLSTPEGTRALYGRIASAAQALCGPSFSLWDANRHGNWKICYRATIDQAVRQLNLPNLTALHEGPTHRPGRETGLRAFNLTDGHFASSTTDGR
jgi:UrcA family protein